MKVRDLAMDGGYRFIGGGPYHRGEILAVRPEFDNPCRYRLVILMPDDTQVQIILNGDTEIEVEDDPFINL